MYKRQWEIANIYQSSRASFQNKKLLVQQEITTMSNRTSIATSDSETEHFGTYDMRPPVSKIKASSKRDSRTVKKIGKKKQIKNASYRDNVSERLRSEDFDVEIFNSLTFRQGDGVVTIKTPFEDKSHDLYVMTHYKTENIENVPVKDRWKFSESTVRLYTSDESKDQTLNTSLNETMQTIFDKLLADPKRQTIKSKTVI